MEDLVEQNPEWTLPDLYKKDGELDETVITQVSQAVAERDAPYLSWFFEAAHEADLGVILEHLEKETRGALAQLLGEDFDFSALTEVNDVIRSEIIEALPVEAIASGMRDLDQDDAVFILEDLDDDERERILEGLPAFERQAISKALDYPEDSAGRRMQADFIAVPPFWTVGQTIDYIRESTSLPNQFAAIYVVTPSFHLLGSIALDQFLRTKRDIRIEDIMEEVARPILATLDQEEAARIFERYNLLSAAVTDETGRLVGVLTIDDIVDVIQEEADEDIKRLAGVGDEEISDSVEDAVKSRFVWLLANLATAVLASIVIGFFDATISQMVALAVLMPIVASMGGNAGTQTMTVAVRAIATRELDRNRTRRFIFRELAVGFINGMLFAVIVSVVAVIWFQNVQLAAVIGVAMIVNMVCAGLAGILIPVGLERLKIDPAIASSAFVTTVTDIVGFFAFLGLAAWWFGIG